MAEYILYDENIYIHADENKQRPVGADELPGILSGKKGVRAVAHGVLVRTFDADMKTMDRIIEVEFSDDTLLQIEKIDDKLQQVYHVSRSLVEKIHRFGEIDLIVPYSLSLRLFLENKGIFSQREKIVFLDKCEHMLFITVFNRYLIELQRRIPHDTARLTWEVIRTLHIYHTNKKDMEIDAIITNDRETFSSIKPEEVGKEVVLIDAPYPSIEGLKIADFNHGLYLPEEIAYKHQEIERRRKSRFIIASFIAVGLILLLNLLLWDKYSKNQIALTKVRANIENMKDALIEMNIKGYRQVILNQSPDFQTISAELNNAMPEGYEIDRMVIYRNGFRWKMEAYIVIREASQFIPEILHESIKSLPLFSKAKITETISNSKRAFKIITDI